MTTDNHLVEEIIERSFTDPYEPDHQNGPDYVIPSEDFATWAANGATKLLLTPDSESNYKPMSVISFMKNTVDSYPNHTALAVKRNNQWVKWSYTNYWDDVRVAARGFIKLGLKPYHGVVMLGFNAPEWLISHLGAIFAGGFATGIYTTNSPEASFHILNDSSANIVVVENETQLQKILKVRESLPHLKAIIQYTGTPTHGDVFSWNDLMAIGRSLPEEILEKRIKGLAINQCCCLIYTSGTTGNAKGVMISHDNVLFMVRCLANMINFGHVNFGKEVGISYLPLSHIAATGGDIYAAIYSAAAIYFASPDALKGQLVQTLTEVRPTAFVGVPRIYEKIYEKLVEAEANLPPTKRRLLSWARKQILTHHMSGSRKTVGYKIAKNLFCKKIKKKLGFDKIYFCIGGGAPMSIEAQKYLLSLDILILEGYGLSENTGMHVVSNRDDFRMGSVGKANRIPEMEVKIENPDEDGNGEILLRGRDVFMGYLKMEDKTLETLTPDRWLHSGDIGKIDSNGYLYITGRIKELVITSGGENIPPSFIEETLKQYLPVISNCILIGDKRKYLTMLITIKVELDMDTFLPLEQLASPTIKWCHKIGCEAQTVADILKGPDEKVMAAIQAGIDRYNNESAISHAQRIQKWKILEQDFSIPGGELGPTAKMKRPFILQKYSDVIESMYSGEEK